MKLGFIGCGNMASAILKGAVGSGFIEGKNVFVFDIDTVKSKALNESLKVNVCLYANEVVKNSDIVVLAVKPQMFPTVLKNISRAVVDNKTAVVSIGAGKTLEFIGSYFDSPVPVVRVMPNLNAAVGASMSAVCGNQWADDSLVEQVCMLCRSFGDVIELPEEQFSLFSGIAGCSPAYVFMFIDTLARSAVKNGMNKQDALRISAQAVLGSAKTILESPQHPWELIDSVCSPGGTTIEGVVSLQNDGFESAVIRAVDASLQKDKKL